MRHRENYCFAVFLKEEKALEYEKEATILENKGQMDTEDVQKVSLQHLFLLWENFFC